MVSCIRVSGMVRSVRFLLRQPARLLQPKSESDRSSLVDIQNFMEQKQPSSAVVSTYIVHVHSIASVPIFLEKSNVFLCIRFNHSERENHCFLCPKRPPLRHRNNGVAITTEGVNDQWERPCRAFEQPPTGVIRSQESLILHVFSPSNPKESPITTISRLRFCRSLVSKATSLHPLPVDNTAMRYHTKCHPFLHFPFARAS